MKVLIYLADGSGCFTPALPHIKSRERLEMENQALCEALLASQSEVRNLRMRLLAAQMNMTALEAEVVIARYKSRL